MPTYGFVIDLKKCIGCHACSIACKSEHDVPLGERAAERARHERHVELDDLRHQAREAGQPAVAGADVVDRDPEAELAQARAEEQVIAEELARVTEVKTRAEVRLRRADIEIRNAMKLLETKEGEEA